MLRSVESHSRDALLVRTTVCVAGEDTTAVRVSCCCV